LKVKGWKPPLHLGERLPKTFWPLYFVGEKKVVGGKRIGQWKWSGTKRKNVNATDR